MIILLILSLFNSREKTSNFDFIYCLVSLMACLNQAIPLTGSLLIENSLVMVS